MKKPRITLIVLALLAVVTLAASGQTVRRHLPADTMPPQADAAHILVYPAGGPEADAAWTEINQTLAVHGCQLEVHRRAQADGTERTVVIVQAVTRTISMP